MRRPARRRPTASWRRSARGSRTSDVAAIGAPEPGRPSPLVSEDRRSVYLPVTFYTAADEDAAADALVARLRDEPGVTVGGGIVAFNQVGDQVEADLQRAELLAAPILLLFSLLVFRSLVAALLPLAVGTATVLLTFSGLRLINEFEPMSTFAINLTTGLGLGLAIDYSLFMVSRFREELAADEDRSRAVRETVRTAGRTVLFSAFTVAAALAAMLVFQLRFLYSMGAGGVLVALSAALVSLTLLPALLAVLGPRVNALGLRRWRVAMQRDAAHVQAGPWYRFSRAVMRRPGARRRVRRRAADRDGAAVPADRVHRRRRVRAAAREVRARGRRRDPRRVPARADVARARRGRRGGARAPGGGGLRAPAGGARRRREREPARAGGRLLALRRGARARRAVGVGEGPRRGRARARRALSRPGRRRDGRLPRPAGARSATRCRSRSRSSRRRRSSSCSR